MKKHVISYLGDFLFAPERARSPVKSLSGGERNRLLLARLFTRPANVLVLDEPTNDLDIETLELLEELLANYDGTLFLVSHDRAFLDNVVTQVIAFEGNGKLREYVGGYEDWVRVKKFEADSKPSLSPREEGRSNRPKPAASSQSSPRREAGAKKLSFREQRELEEIPQRIEMLEEEQGKIATELGSGSLYRDNPQKAKQLQERTAAIEEELMQLMKRWEALESRG